MSYQYYPKKNNLFVECDEQIKPVIIGSFVFRVQLNGLVA